MAKQVGVTGMPPQRGKVEIRGVVPEDFRQFFRRWMALKSYQSNGDYSQGDAIMEGLLLLFQTPENIELIRRHGLIEDVKASGLDLSFLEGTLLEQTEGE